ncbi:MAG TPA: Holliday junction branch migration protein RuvA [Vicinamibacterales bacterium]|nr:Holliday junction branch migration protein RuvA [Vicinamibacterales bacterium]
MIARLKGTLVEKSPNRLIVDVAGVGYDILVPLSTFYGMGEAGSVVTLRVHTHVREDVIALYGFNTVLERDLFERLIAINGIGPKLALAVLSGIDTADLVRAIRTQDVARLTRIPGVGRKTAERIGLELKDRLPQGTEVDIATSDGGDRRTDLLSALTNLGYKGAVAEKAVDAALKRAPDAPFEDLLRDVLRGMMK